MQPGKNAPTDDNIENIVISDVGASAWSYIKTKYKWQLKLAVVGSALYYIAAFYLFTKIHQTTDNLKGEGFILLPPLLIVGAWYQSVWTKFEDEFLGQFARANGFTFSKNGAVDELYGTIFRVKGSHHVSDIISGKYRDLDLRIFLYNLSVGSGRSQQTWMETVFEVDYPVKLPHLLLSDKATNDLYLNREFKADKVELEGGFSKDFELYVPPGLQVEALQVFTPDVMEVIESVKGQFSLIELSGNKIYVLIDHYISDTKDMRAAFTLVRTLVNKLALVVNDFKVDPTASEETANIASTAKKSKITLENIMYALFLFILISMCVALFLARAWQY